MANVCVSFVFTIAPSFGKVGTGLAVKERAKYDRFSG